MLGIVLDNSIADRWRRRKAPLVGALVGIMTLQTTFVASDLRKWTRRRNTWSWSLELRLGLTALVVWVEETKTTRILLVVVGRSDHWRRWKPKLLLLCDHLGRRGGVNGISDPLFGSFHLEQGCLLLKCHVIELIKLIRLEQGESKLEFILQTTTELIDLALGIWDVLLSIAGKVLELDIILVDRH